MSRRVACLVLAVLSVTTSGCRLRVGTELAVGPDGGGTFGVVVALDDETRDILEEAGFDPLLGVTELAAGTAGWRVDEVELGEDRGLRVAAEFDDPEEFDALAAGFHAGLDAADGAIFDTLDLDRTSDGRISFSGRAGITPPTVPGADGQGLAFDADDLERLLADRADELVRYDLVLTLPAPAVDHDADLVEGRTLTWHLPVGEQRAIHAVSEPPTERLAWILAGLALLAAVVGAVATVLWRRRAAAR